MPAPVTPRPPLCRPRRGKWVAGVCVGLAEHLGLSLKLVRLVMVFGVTVGSPILYVWLWVFTPVQVTQVAPVNLARLAPRINQSLSPSDKSLPQSLWQWLAGAGVLLSIAALLIVNSTGLLADAPWLLPGGLVLLGTAVVWSQFAGATAADLKVFSGRYPVIVLGLTGVIAGLLWYFSTWVSLDMLIWGALATFMILVVLALVLAPGVQRVIRSVTAMQAAKVRETERADIAAHLHDSVLQTLSLIRSRADDPHTVQRLARSQERELRAWLYEDRGAQGTSVAGMIKQLCGEIEDLYGGVIDAVVVGDTVPGEYCQSFLAATREALINAVRHGSPPVSLYAELAKTQVQVYVRDRGQGFDLTQVAVDRHGVKESIIGRTERNGGTAKVKSGPSGTEIHLLYDIDGGEGSGNTTEHSHS